MAILPVLRDDNGCVLPGYGSELFTRRFTGVGTEGQAISLGVDAKRIIVHIEGANIQARLQGTAQGSQVVNWTSDGVTLPELTLVKEADQTIATVFAMLGTINVSVIAWR